MNEIWAGSAQNVYMIGHCDFLDGSLYYYDGNKWNSNSELLYIINSSYYLNGIFGFSSDNVYIVGRWSDPLPPHNDHSLIIKYNGSIWEMTDLPHNEWLEGIWGSAPDDIWIGGTNGTIIHYNGNIWDIDSLPHPGYPDLEISLYVNRISGDSHQNIRAITYSVFPGANILYHTFLYSEGQWTIEDSSWNYELSITDLWISPEETWYKGTDRGLYQLWGSSWTSISEKIKIWSVHGTSDNNIFICGQLYDTFYIMHYNGTDWFTYESLTRHKDIVIYTDVFLIRDEVFICGYTPGAWPQKSVILHGK
jgi:hypothetical protein